MYGPERDMHFAEVKGMGRRGESNRHEQVASARVRIWIKRLTVPAGIVVGAVVLRVIAGVGFVNYDTLYALAWGGQLSRGSTPAYGVPIAPTPHPLVEILGVVLAPLGPHGVVEVTVALAFLALSACTWVVYALAARWFGRAAGALAALLLITRVPVLSYGVRAYIDVPYLLLVLGALLIDRSEIGQRRPRAGWPVLGLLALAGLLRPEAWAWSGLYWLYLIAWPAWRRRLDWDRRAPGWLRRRSASGGPGSADGGRTSTDTWTPGRSRREIAGLTLLAAAAPLVWVLSDLLITGDALWSLTNTRHTAQTLDRVTGIANVPEYIPRRIGEILRPPVLVGAALGGVLSLLWLGSRARLAAIVGVVAVLVFAAFAAVGLPINTRYAFLAAAILCVFCGAGVFGWTLLDKADPRRRWWMAGGLVVLVALVAYAPSQYRSAHRQLSALARQQHIEDDLVALVRSHAIGLGCGPVEVPNHAPIPLLSLYLRTSPANVISAQVNQIAYGAYVDPASVEVERDYVLDPHDPHLPVTVPPGFTESATNRSWLIFKRCQ
jgi:hypothetical protein